MDPMTAFFIDFQYVIVIFFTLFAGTVLGLGLCGKTRRPEGKVDDPARRARMQNLMNRTDRAANDADASEGRSLAREAPHEYRSKRHPPRKQHDELDEGESATPRSRASAMGQDRSISKRKKKSAGGDSSRRKKQSRMYGVTESKRGQPSGEPMPPENEPIPEQPRENKAPAEVEYKSNESKLRSARDGKGESPRNVAASPKRNAESPRRPSKENSHSRRTKVITFDQKSGSKSRRSTSAEMPVDVTQEDQSPPHREDPEAFPFKDKSQASQDRRAPRGKTCDLRDDETQTLQEDQTQRSCTESRVTRSKIRQIGELPSSSGVSRVGSPKKKRQSGNSVATGVPKEKTEDGSRRTKKTQDDGDQSKKSREGGSKLDRSDRSGKSSKSNRKSKKDVLSTSTRKRASQEKHDQLKELRRSVNKKLKSRTDDEPSAESPFGSKGKKTRKDDAEQKDKKVKIRTSKISKPEKLADKRNTEQTEEKQQALALYPNTTVTRTEGDGGRSEKTKEAEKKSPIRVKSPKRAKPPVEEAEPDSQTGRVTSSTKVNKTSPREPSSNAKSDRNDDQQCCSSPREREKTCQSPSAGITFEGVPRHLSDPTQDPTLPTVTAPDKTLTTQTAADSTVHTQRTQTAATHSIGAGLNTYEMTAIETQKTQTAATQSIGAGMNTFEMTAIQTDQTQKTQATLAATQADSVSTQKTQATQCTAEVVTAAERTKKYHCSNADERTEDLFSPATQKTQADTVTKTKSLALKSGGKTQKTQVASKTENDLQTEKTQKVSDVKTAEIKQQSITCKSSDYVPNIEPPPFDAAKPPQTDSVKDTGSEKLQKKKRPVNDIPKKTDSTSSKKKMPRKKRKAVSKSVELEPVNPGHNLDIAPVHGSIKQLPGSSGSSSSRRRKKKSGKVTTVPSKNKAIDSLDCQQSTKLMISVDKPGKSGGKSGGNTAEGSVEKRGGDDPSYDGTASTEQSVEMPARQKSEKTKTKSMAADATQKLESSSKSISNKIKSKAKSKLDFLMKSPQSRD